jgi:hypothetical protein
MKLEDDSELWVRIRRFLRSSQFVGETEENYDKYQPL